MTDRKSKVIRRERLLQVQHKFDALMGEFKEIRYVGSLVVTLFCKNGGVRNSSMTMSLPEFLFTGIVDGEGDQREEYKTLLASTRLQEVLLYLKQTRHMGSARFELKFTDIGVIDGPLTIDYPGYFTD